MMTHIYWNITKLKEETQEEGQSKIHVYDKKIYNTQCTAS